ncbi:MAG: hypothetical protein J0H62_00835 [Rhizobiales bacterium]|nr:hypothetical protein [Hyphomicrobiales bacterium]
MAATVSKLIGELGENFIGLWRFRVYGKRRSWCVTLHVGGDYYDTMARATPELALADAIKTRDRILKKGPARR